MIRPNGFIAFGQGNFYFQPFLWAGRTWYGGRAAVARRSQVIRVTLSAADLRVRVSPTYQHRCEQVIRARLSVACYRRWLGWLGQRHPVLFHFFWRAIELHHRLIGNLSWTGLKRVLSDPTATIQRLGDAVRNPGHR